MTAAIIHNLKKIWSELIPAQGILLAGVSGGADSVALLYLLAEQIPRANQRLVAVHINHGLRGQASRADETLVCRHCAALGVWSLVYRKNVRKIAQAQKLSLEEAGRKIRQECFLDAARILKAQAVILAHHQDDQAETVLLNLMRGAGAQGLSGMQVSRPFPHPLAPPGLKLIRPLLHFRKKDLQAYLKDRHLRWREDRSNQDQTFRRNKFRQTIVPLLEKTLHPQIKAMLAKSAESLARDDDFLQQMAQAALKRTLQSHAAHRVVLLRRSLRPLPASLQWRVFSLLWDQLQIPQKSSAHLERLVEAIQHDQPGFSMPGGWQATSRGEHILLTSETDQRKGMNPELLYGVKKIIQIKPEVLPYPPAHSDWVLMDAEKIPRKTLLRIYQKQDFIRPLGMRGKRKTLKKIFSEMKLLPEERSHWPFLASGSEVIWIYRGPLSEKVKITPQTKKVLRVEIYRMK